MLVMTWNMQGYNGATQELKLTNLLRIVRQAIADMPNVIMLQECTSFANLQFTHIPNTLLSTAIWRFGTRTRGIGYRIIYRNWFGPAGGNQRCSMAIMYRQNHITPDAPDEINELRVGEVHLNHPAVRPAVIVSIPVLDGEDRTFVCMHTWPGYIDALSTLLLEHPLIGGEMANPQACIGGDFNMQPNAGEPHDGWVIRSPMLPTHNAGVIDYFLTRDGNFQWCQRINDDFGSDHFPVLMRWD